MNWKLSEEWGVGLDPYNWILYRSTGKRWRGISFYRTPEELFAGLHRKILRRNGPTDDLLQYLESCLSVAETCTRRFRGLVVADLGSLAKLPANQASPITGGASNDEA